MVSRQLDCPVFKLTHADIRNGFEPFIERVESQIEEYGIAKLVPPINWTPRMAGYNDELDFTIPRPIRQNVTGGRGIFRTILVEEKPMSVKTDFRPMAMLPENNPKSAENIEDLEYQFWRNLRFQPPLYGADVEGSLFDEDLQGWNLRHLNTILSRTLEEKGHSIPGVVTPYLYFGMWRSIFAWHTEDMDLYSVNYLHYGAPKSWYAIQPTHRKKFEELVQNLAETQDLFKSCSEFMRHKELVISPEVLKQHGIPYVRVVQNPGEFIINYPGAYHSGFNHGFNCAESTNFATKRWVSVGAKAHFCGCRKDTVKIDMALFGVAPPPESESEAEDSPPKSANQPQTAKTPEKRGRGRPPGSKNKAKGTPSAAKPAQAVAAGTVKRGRGRPRKNPLPDPNQPKRPRGIADGGKAKPEYPMPVLPPGVKRPRGRPRKDGLLPGSAEATAADMAKGKKGGIKPQAATAVDSAAPPAKRKRGRPSNKDVEESAAAALSGLGAQSLLPLAAAPAPVAPASSSGEAGPSSAPPADPAMVAKRPRGRPRKVSCAPSLPLTLYGNALQARGTDSSPHPTLGILSQDGLPAGSVKPVK
eukprot:CAMPEP_0117659286 /NCGR_PEP_ID=MMETSP0804-20121206/6342_1 /TAXON_ID=1074897 /ORGANISM="Tetraselmis astigmatica, Strain CCMP880" /LENGTH=586 /DNA_ID=CAMNT_0005465915 /DNA_START=150 /DNA_END=1910 /DNA_ORIENTATION=-